MVRHVIAIGGRRFGALEDVLDVLYIHGSFDTNWEHFHERRDDVINLRPKVHRSICVKKKKKTKKTRHGQKAEAKTRGK